MKLYFMIIRGKSDLIKKCYNEIAPMLKNKKLIKKYLDTIYLWSVSGLFMKDLKEHLKVIFDNKLSVEYY